MVWLHLNIYTNTELVLIEPRHLVDWRRPHTDETNLFVHYYETVILF